jgi:DNA polymerase-4
MTGSPALIMYLDIDAFFPSVEQVRFPHLRGRPVVVGSGVVASSSYEARRRGIRTGMPIAMAVRICPEVVVLKGHQHVYASFAEHIFDRCRRLTPVVETYLDEAFCDLAGTAAARRDPLEVGSELRAAIREEVGPSVTVGFASNRMIAKLAAKAVKPDGLAWVKPGGEEAFMEERPVGDVPGIGHVAAEILRQINVTRVSDLKQFPARYLEAIFGRRSPLIYERLRGRDPYVRPSFPKSISRETSFTRDTADRREIAATLYYLAERACRAARTLRALPTHIETRVRYGDGESGTMRATYREASVLDRAVFGLANGLLDRMYRRCQVRLVGVTLSGLVRADCEQGSLGCDPDASRLTDLYRALDSVRAKFGHSAVIAGRSVDLMSKLERDSYGYILRTPSLTK